MGLFRPNHQTRYNRLTGPHRKANEPRAEALQLIGTGGGLEAALFPFGKKKKQPVPFQNLERVRVRGLDAA